MLWCLQPNERKPDRVMVISHDRVVLDGLASVLQRRGMVATTIGGSEYDIFRLWDAYLDFGPDVLVVDADLPGMSTESFCRVVRDDASSQLLPVIFIGGGRDQKDVLELLAVGADDYVRKDDLSGTLVPKIEHWLRRVQWQRETAYVDPLTGLLNRRGARTALARSFDLVHRSHSVMSLVLLDLDNFKQINTRFGLSAGDEALRRLADRLRETFKRQIDVVARYGGEEFLLGLSSTEKSDAVRRLNELLADLESRHLCDAIPEPVTFSAGVATYPFDATDLDGLREIASRRMGRAKELGKRRVESGA